MPRTLSSAQVEAFDRDGYLFPFKAFAPETAASYRARLEAFEASEGGPIRSNMRHKVHLLFTWANEIVRHPRILDAVEDIIGANILCWSTNFFIKEARDPGFVSWHQDSTYWGREPPEVVTAWVALSDVPLEAGPMKFLAGSHHLDQFAHHDTFHEHNLLSRGQVIDLTIEEERAVDASLKAGEFSLHHIRLVHGSRPNRTDDRRIGLAIRYIPPHVRPVKAANSAMLVRGVDACGHFEMEPDPASDLDPAALAAHEDAMKRQLGALYEGTDVTVARD